MAILVSLSNARGLTENRVWSVVLISFILFFVENVLQIPLCQWCIATSSSTTGTFIVFPTVLLWLSFAGWHVHCCMASLREMNAECDMRCPWWWCIRRGKPAWWAPNLRLWALQSWAKITSLLRRNGQKSVLSRKDTFLSNWPQWSSDCGWWASAMKQWQRVLSLTHWDLSNHTLQCEGKLKCFMRKNAFLLNWHKWSSNCGWCASVIEWWQRVLSLAHSKKESIKQDLPPSKKLHPQNNGNNTSLFTCKRLMVKQRKREKMQNKGSQFGANSEEKTTMRKSKTKDHWSHSNHRQKGQKKKFNSGIGLVHAQKITNKWDQNSAARVVEKWFEQMKNALVTIGIKKCTPWASPRWEKAEKVVCMFGTPFVCNQTVWHQSSVSAEVCFSGVNEGIFWSSVWILDTFSLTWHLPNWGTESGLALWVSSGQVLQIELWVSVMNSNGQSSCLIWKILVSWSWIPIAWNLFWKKVDSKEGANSSKQLQHLLKNGWQWPNQIMNACDWVWLVLNSGFGVPFWEKGMHQQGRSKNRSSLSFSMTMGHQVHWGFVTSLRLRLFWKWVLVGHFASGGSLFGRSLCTSPQRWICRSEFQGRPSSQEIFWR